MTAPATQTAPVRSSNAGMSVSVSTEYGTAPEGGYRPSFTTKVGRAWKHGKGRGINVQMDLVPMLTTDNRLVMFAGKGLKFEGGAEKLAAYDVTEFTGSDGETKKRWQRIGTALLSRNAAAYDILLSALPSTGKITLIEPKDQNETAAQAEQAPAAETPADVEAPF